MGNCAGIDWASEKHDVLIADETGTELLGETFAHNEKGITALCDALKCFEVEVVAIERPDGVLVERLLEAGVQVLALHPNQVKAARDLTRSLQMLVEQIRELESEIADALQAHPDGEIFRSFFRSRESVICAATLLSEIGDCRGRYPHRDAIAADAGQAPVAVESGKRKNAKFRWACNKRLRNALSTLAHNTCRWNPWAADRYGNARKRGHNHRRALRTLGRAWARIIWRCWQNHTPYDPNRHTGLQQHITVAIPTSSGPRPDVPATQRMAGAAVTSQAARRAERAALDSQPPAAISIEA